MKFLKLALCGATAGLAMAGAAHAEVSVNAGVVSQYLFRGLSQGADAAGFGGVDWSGESGAYAGLWTSSVGFASAEVDAYGGWKGSSGDFDFDVGAIYYGYVNDGTTWVNATTHAGDPSIDAAYYEVYAKGSFPVGMGSITGAIYYSPEYFAEAGPATYYEVGFTAPWKDVVISGAFGIQNISDPETGAFRCGGSGCEDSYTTWNIGFTVPINDVASVDVRYTSTNDHAAAFGNSNLYGVDFDGITAKLTTTFK